MLAGPPISGPSVICGPLALDRDGERAVSRRENASFAVFTERKDPGTFRKFCHGDYTACSIWQAEKDRIEAARLGLDAPLGGE
jgi:hypothetical protein